MLNDSKYDKNSNLLEYKSDDAILIMDSNDEIRLLLPIANLKDTDIIPDHVALLSAFVSKVSVDEDFKIDLLNWYEEQTKNFISTITPQWDN